MAVVEMNVANSDASRWSDARYVSPMFVDDASLLRREWRELSTNASRAPPSVSIVFEPIGRLHYSVLQQMHEASSLYAQMGMGEREIDELKWMLFSRPIHVLVAMRVERPDGAPRRGARRVHVRCRAVRLDGTHSPCGGVRACGRVGAPRGRS